MKELMKFFKSILDFLRGYIFFRKSVIAVDNKRKFKLLKRKIYLFLVIVCDLVILPFAILFVILVRALRPFVLVRFGHTNSRRVGHCAVNTELYLCRMDMKKGRVNYSIDLFFHLAPACNKQLIKMWNRILHVSYFVNYLYRVSCLLPNFEKHIISCEELAEQDYDGLLAHTSPHLFFTTKEQLIGNDALKKMGISNGNPFVCFYVRDELYLNNLFKSRFYYHNYRDSNVQNCRLAAEAMTKRGYFMIRMGKLVKEEFYTNNPRIIDYSTKYRTDFLDLYLLSKCHFFISSPAGISSVAVIFRKPIAWLNMIPLVYITAWGIKDIFIPKKLWLKNERRFMTFREIIDSGTGLFLSTEKYDQHGIQVIENTPEEIESLAIEMDERLNGTWHNSKEDEELQSRFQGLFKNIRMQGKHVSRIGADFLRQNKELLE